MAKTAEQKEKISKFMVERNRQQKEAAPKLTKPISVEAQLNNYLIDYDVRLMEIERRYPIGDKDRAEWLLAHRCNGVKHILEITGGKG